MSLPAKIENVRSIDELIRFRAQNDPSTPIIAYPNAPFQWTDYTAADLNRYAFRAAKAYEQAIPAPAADAPKKVVGLLGPSNIDYVITLYSLLKLGHTVLLLSTRLSDIAYTHLLEKTECTDIIAHPQFHLTVKRVQLSTEVKEHQLATPAVYAGDPREGENVFQVWTNPAREKANACWIIHSSGSTGLPKPISHTNISVLNSCFGMISQGNVAVTTLPMFHTYGIFNNIWAYCYGKKLCLSDASQPLTGPTLTKYLEILEPAIFFVVPYGLKLVAETEGGIDIMKKCERVMFGGASCPKELGDDLTEKGVQLEAYFGSTEAGALMSSTRNMEMDKEWDYLHTLSGFAPYAEWAPEGDGVFELVVLAGWPSKRYSNREDGAYKTSDLFEQHPQDPDKFRYIGRKDDTIILSNGENANPIPFEHTVRTHKDVKEVIVYGQERANLVMLVIPAEHVDDNISREEFVDRIWPHIESANTRVPSFSKISKDAVGMLSKESEYATTDKGTAIRPQFYKKYMPAIDTIYQELNGGEEGEGLELSLEETTEFVHHALIEVLDLKDPSILKNDSDFFSLGLDSLQALALRRKLRDLSTGDKPVGQNVAFEHPTVESLAKFFYELRTGQQSEQMSGIEKMQYLINKYSEFPSHLPGTVSVDGEYVVLTGATGSLGAQLAATLAKRESVKKVYCLVRAKSFENAKERTIDSLKERMVYEDLSTAELSKLVCLPSDLSRDDLGLEPATFDEIVKNNTAVIHNAWAVNFNMDVTSFEAQHIGGSYNLIKLCLKSPHASIPSFNFCSSISTMMGRNEPVLPEVLPNLEDAVMGYGRSKLVTEYICTAAANKTGMAARIHRIGQLVGDTKHGLWNSKESIPLAVQSARIVKALPFAENDDFPSWLPIDTTAETIVELTLLDHKTSPEEPERDAVFQVLMPKLVSWNNVFLPGLRAAGLEFETVTKEEWIRRLKASPQDPKINPSIKLMDFFESSFLMHVPEVQTDRAQSFSPALKDASPVDQELVGKFLKYWQTKW